MVSRFALTALIVFSLVPSAVRGQDAKSSDLAKQLALAPFNQQLHAKLILQPCQGGGSRAEHPYDALGIGCVQFSS